MAAPAHSPTYQRFITATLSLYFSADGTPHFICEATQKAVTRAYGVPRHVFERRPGPTKQGVIFGYVFASWAELVAHFCGLALKGLLSEGEFNHIHEWTDAQVEAGTVEQFGLDANEEMHRRRMVKELRKQQVADSINVGRVLNEFAAPHEVTGYTVIMWPKAHAIAVARADPDEGLLEKLRQRVGVDRMPVTDVPDDETYTVQCGGIGERYRRSLMAIDAKPRKAKRVRSKAPAPPVVDEENQAPAE